MDNFDLKKYLSEGRLLKEDIASKAISVLKSYEGEVEGVEGYIKYLMNTSDDISSSIQAIADDLDRDKPSSDSLRRDLEKLSLAEGRLFKENVDFPELEDEFEGAMDAMVVEPKVYLQDIIDASAEEIVSDDYYEIMNAVEQGVYSEVEAVKLAKAWAKEKLSNLAEGKLNLRELDNEGTINENTSDKSFKNLKQALSKYRNTRAGSKDPVNDSIYKKIEDLIRQL